MMIFTIIGMFVVAGALAFVGKKAYDKYKATQAPKE